MFFYSRDDLITGFHCISIVTKFGLGMCDCVTINVKTETLDLDSKVEPL